MKIIKFIHKHFRLPIALYRRVHQLADERGLSDNTMIVLLLEKALGTD